MLLLFISESKGLWNSDEQFGFMCISQWTQQVPKSILGLFCQLEMHRWSIMLNNRQTLHIDSC